jgi:hypothetical protein
VYDGAMQLRVFLIGSNFQTYKIFDKHSWQKPRVAMDQDAPTGMKEKFNK